MHTSWTGKADVVTDTSTRLAVASVSTGVMDVLVTMESVSVSVAFDGTPTGQPRTSPLTSSFIAHTRSPQQPPTAIIPPSLVTRASDKKLPEYIFCHTRSPS